MDVKCSWRLLQEKGFRFWQHCRRAMYLILRQIYSGRFCRLVTFAVACWTLHVHDSMPPPPATDLSFVFDSDYVYT